MVGSIKGEIQLRVKDGFSILVLVTYTERIFGDTVNIYRIALVTQAQQRPHLILNLLAKPDKRMPSVNKIIDREITLE